MLRAHRLFQYALSMHRRGPAWCAMGPDVWHFYAALASYGTFWNGPPHLRLFKPFLLGSAALVMEEVLARLGAPRSRALLPTMHQLVHMLDLPPVPRVRTGR
jgi:hypothetical protein